MNIRLVVFGLLIAFSLSAPRLEKVAEAREALEDYPVRITDYYGVYAPPEISSLGRAIQPFIDMPTRMKKGYATQLAVHVEQLMKAYEAFMDARHLSSCVPGVELSIVYRELVVSICAALTEINNTLDCFLGINSASDLVTEFERLRGIERKLADVAKSSCFSFLLLTSKAKTRAKSLRRYSLASSTLFL